MPIIHLTPPSISNAHVAEKITCIRPRHRLATQVYGEEKYGKFIYHNYGHGGSGWTMLFGSIQRMLNDFDKKLELDTTLKNKPVRVVGAGCIGMLSAIVLAERGHNVSIIAQATDNLTSHRAVGVFFPCSRFAKSKQQKQINTDSLLTCKSILAESHRFLTPDTVKLLPDYVDLDNDYSGLDFWGPGNVVTLDFGNGKQHNVMAYKTILINVHETMRQLRAYAHKLGIPITIGTVATLEELNEPIVINCAGLGARTLNADKYLMPVQGHLLQLHNQPIKDLQYVINIKNNQTERLLYFAPKGYGIIGVTNIDNEERLDTNSHEFDNLLNDAGNFFGWTP